MLKIISVLFRLVYARVRIWTYHTILRKKYLKLPNDYHAWLKAWHYAHGKTPPPILNIGGKVVWINRAQRRKNIALSKSAR